MRQPSIFLARATWWLLSLGMGCGPVSGPAAAGFDWRPGEGFRWAELPAPEGTPPGFTRISPEASGVTFTNLLAEATLVQNRIPANGSGVALGDVDGDGLCDLYLCRLEGDNVLYRNLGGWRFEDITVAAGVACAGQMSSGAALADVDGDSDPDLLVNGFGVGTRLFLNDGGAKFTEAAESGLARQGGSTSLALADADADGDLDLYVANYRTDTWQDRPPGLNVEVQIIGGQPVVTPPNRFVPLRAREGGAELMERGEPDAFYLNDGKGRFRHVSWPEGSFLDDAGRSLADAPTDWGLGVLFRDLNGDLAPDLYVCNDFFYWPDRVWMNRGDGRFRAAEPFTFRKQSVSTMGGDLADINRDGHFDLFVTDMVSRRHDRRQRQRPQMMQDSVLQLSDTAAARPEVAQNTLQLARSDGTFAEISHLAGIAFTEWSWGALFLDVDLDGWEDLIIPTGSRHDVQDGDAVQEQQRFQQLPDTLETRLASWQLFPPLRTPVIGLRNRRDLTFRDAGAEWGFDEPGVWQGAAFADLDLDGDLDLVINRLDGPAGLFRNNSPAPRVAVRLKGSAPNTAGVGALIRMTGGPVAQSQEMIAGGRYFSDDDDLRVFAAGNTTNRLRIEVTWRDGRRSVLEDVRSGRVYEIDQAGAQAAHDDTSPVQAAPEPVWFETAATLANPHAPAQTFNDFTRQPLLARKPSTLGPAVGWFDLDDDGHEDLLVGARWGATPAVWRNDGNGGFTDLTPAAIGEPRRGVAGGLAGRIEATGSRSLLITEMTLDAGGIGAQVRTFVGGESSVSTGDLQLRGVPGPMALTDVDGDGSLELFVGAQSAPGRFPEPGNSRLLRSQGRAWASGPVLSGLGPVNAVCFTDLTGDGLPELALACDWSPLHLFRNDGGRFKAWDPIVQTSRLDSPNSRFRSATKLSTLSGWWNSVAAGDFNNDGRLDLVVGGWGRNTRFQRYLTHPLRLYVGDFDEDGVLELLDTCLDPEQGRYVPWRPYEVVRREIPFVADVAETYRAYGETGIEQLLGSRLAATSVREAAVLDSLLLLNHGDSFEARPLPVEAQFAPVFGLAVADFDADGNEDLFLAQNYFGVEPETPRYDAGRSLVLRGDGRGGFAALDARESGIALYGESRACAVGDYDRDGCVDLAVSQADGSAIVLRNRLGIPGLRVRLQGPPDNPTGIGAVLRLERGGEPGPARELRAGAGLWSQDGAVTILPAGDSPARLHVRWPGGRTTEHSVPAGAREVVVPPQAVSPSW